MNAYSDKESCRCLCARFSFSLPPKVKHDPMSYEMSEAVQRTFCFRAVVGMIMDGLIKIKGLRSFSTRTLIGNRRLGPRSERLMIIYYGEMGALHATFDENVL
jgi:hypothetical protein